MDVKQKNSLLAVGIVVGLLSLPTTWLTIHDATIGSPFPGEMGKQFGSITLGTLPVSGLAGSVTFPVEAPLWFLVGLAIFAGVLQLMQHSPIFAIPKFVEWAAAIAGIVWMCVPMVVTLFSGQATLGIGCLLGLCCAAMPLVCLVVPADGPMDNGAEDRLPKQ
jgi:hypothetical protein